MQMMLRMDVGAKLLAINIGGGGVE